MPEIPFPRTSVLTIFWEGMPLDPPLQGTTFDSLYLEAPCLKSCIPHN